MPTWAAVLSVVAIAVSIAVAWRGHQARQDPGFQREPLTTEERLRRARDAVAAVWLALISVGLLGPLFGLPRGFGFAGSYLSSCIMLMDGQTPRGTIVCGGEQPGLLVWPLSAGIVATALILTGAYVLGRLYSWLWLLGLGVWTTALVIAGNMAPPSLVCSEGRGGSTTSCLWGWRPGWEWLAIFVVGPLLIALASRLVGPHGRQAETAAIA